MISASKLAVIACVLVAIVECACVAWITRNQVEALPIELIIAGMGKAAITHCIFWIPLCLLATMVCSLIGRPRPDKSYEPLVGALLLVAMGTVLVPMDLAAVNRGRPYLIALGLCGVAAASLLGYALGCRYTRRVRSWRLRRASTQGSLVAIGILLMSCIVFVQSPLFHPARFRATIARPTHQRTHGMPNVLWIVMDTVRADRLACLGGKAELTPSLDQWANKAIVFEQAYSTAVWTLPAHASMFTGTAVREHGTGHDRLWLDDKFITVAESLRREGYRCASFSNNPWIRRSTNMLQGFDYSCSMYHLKRIGHFSLERLVQKVGVKPPLPWLDLDYGASLTNHQVSRWLRSNSATSPVFVFVNYMEAHLPYSVPYEFRCRHLNDKQVARSYRLRHLFGSIVDVLDYQFNIDGGSFLSNDDRAVLIGQYNAAVEYLDKRVAELLAMFESYGMMENTLVIISSDHGEYLGTHGMWSHRFLAYNDTIHVCLMIREPGRENGLHVRTPVLLSDIYRTVMDTTVGTATASTSTNTLNLIELAESGKTDRIAAMEYNGPSKQMISRIGDEWTAALLHRVAPQVVALDGHYKYMRSCDGCCELYDIISDPGELRNLIEVLPDQVESLERFADSWQANTPVYEPPASEQTTQIDRAAIEALRGLGYLGGEVYQEQTSDEDE